MPEKSQPLKWRPGVRTQRVHIHSVSMSIGGAITFCTRVDGVWEVVREHGLEISADHETAITNSLEEMLPGTTDGIRFVVPATSAT